jgi:hypothetical protein
MESALSERQMILTALQSYKDHQQGEAVWSGDHSKHSLMLLLAERWSCLSHEAVVEVQSPEANKLRNAQHVLDDPPCHTVWASDCRAHTLAITDILRHPSMAMPSNSHSHAFGQNSI